jgi:hypothetical protein
MRLHRAAALRLSNFPVSANFAKLTARSGLVFAQQMDQSNLEPTDSCAIARAADPAAFTITFLDDWEVITSSISN